MKMRMGVGMKARRWKLAGAGLRGGIIWVGTARGGERQALIPVPGGDCIRYIDISIISIRGVYFVYFV